MRKQEIVRDDYYALDLAEAMALSDAGRPSVRLLLDLALKLNSTFINASDLDDIFRAVLVGATAGEGLGLNRAFLLLADHEEQVLQGRYAVGPDSPEDAGRIWTEMAQSRPSLFEILETVRDQLNRRDSGINRFVRTLTVSLHDRSCLMVRSLREKSAYLVDTSMWSSLEGARELCETFGSDQIAVVPLYTHDIEYGVIVADNVFSRAPITPDLVYSLHLFASLASMAICQSHICKTLEEKVQGLERLNREVERNRHMLVELESMAVLGRVVDKLFHEIRNPLTAIGGVATLLRRRLSGDTEAGYLDVILKETEKIQKVLDQVAEFQALGAPEPVRIDLCAMIRETIDLLRGELDHVGIASHLNLPDEPVEIEADREQMGQALLCVLKNAVEAMPDGGMLIVSLAREGESVAIRVADTGLGIAKGHFKRVDSPFFTTKMNAFGLGLSRTKQILRHHGGSLTLEPNRVGGTTCIITLPVSFQGREV